MRSALIVALLVATTAASPMHELDLGTQTFRAKDYESTINHINKLLYPEEQLAVPEDLVAAHVLLGASYFETGKRELAKAEFEKALLIDPNKTLDTLLFSAGAVRLFDDTKDDIATRRKRDDELRKLEEERERLRQQLDNIRYVEHRALWVNFVPFGAGQFQSRRIGWGVVFLASEAATFGASAVIYGYITTRYPQICTPQGVCTRPVPLQEVRFANNLQIAEIASAGAGILLVGLGIWDAYRHYKPDVQLNVSPDLLKSLDKKPPKKTSLLDRVHVAPMITPSSVGVGLGWEN